MKRTAIFGAAVLLSFTAVAWAAESVTGEGGSLFDLLRPVSEAFTSGQYLYAGMLALVLVVALTKKYLGPRVPFLHTDVGGSLMTLVGSFAGALATTLAGGAMVNFAMVKAASLIAIGAAGGYSLIKRLLIDPVLRPLAAKAPAWSQPLFSMIFWIFDKKSPVEEAEAAGDAAVAKNPAEGAAPNVTEIK